MFSIPSERIFSSKKYGRKKAKGDKEPQDRKEGKEAQDQQAPTITKSPPTHVGGLFDLFLLHITSSRFHILC